MFFVKSTTLLSLYAYRIQRFHCPVWVYTKPAVIIVSSSVISVAHDVDLSNGLRSLGFRNYHNGIRAELRLPRRYVGPVR